LIAAGADNGRTHERHLRVAVDTSYAGRNPTGVGLYSARIAEHLRNRAAEESFSVRCYGPTCEPDAAASRLTTLVQEWPVYTHGMLPARLLAYRPHVTHSTSHIGPLWGPGHRIVTVHDLIFMRYPEDYNPAWLALTQAILPHVLRRATAIIADSRATKADLTHLLGVRSGKVVVVYPGVDEEYRHPSPGAAPEVDRLQPYILCLGPWVRRKNLDVVVQAFARLAGNFPDLKLVITGRPSPGMRGYTEEGLRTLLPDDVRSRLVLPGYVDRQHLRELVAGASLLAYPSLFEGFGLPPLEAMAAGLPVVAADTPAVAEVTGGAAVIVKPNAPDQWAASMARILQDADYSGNFKRRGVERSALFTWETCARQCVALYRRVAAPRRKAR
jgi:glycosyltransferase involved in cell wall biosynthesis